MTNQEFDRQEFKKLFDLAGPSAAASQRIKLRTIAKLSEPSPAWPSWLLLLSRGERLGALAGLACLAFAIGLLGNDLNNRWLQARVPAQDFLDEAAWFSDEPAGDALSVAAVALAWSAE